MPVTKVTSELPTVEDDTTRDDAGATAPVEQCQLRTSLSLSSVSGAISLTCRSGVGASGARQVAVRTILAARPAVTQVFRESRAALRLSRVACTW